MHYRLKIYYALKRNVAKLTYFRDICRSFAADFFSQNVNFATLRIKVFHTIRFETFRFQIVIGVFRYLLLFIFI